MVGGEMRSRSRSHHITQAWRTKARGEGRGSRTLQQDQFDSRIRFYLRDDEETDERSNYSSNQLEASSRSGMLGRPGKHYEELQGSSLIPFLPIWSSIGNAVKHMLQQHVGDVIKEGLAEGERFALSSSLWRYANPHSPAACDVLMVLRGVVPIKKRCAEAQEEEESSLDDEGSGEEGEAVEEKQKDFQDQAIWVLEMLKRLAPELHIEVRHHRLTNSYALYLSSSYVQMLRGAELCRLKKRLKARFGASLKEFTFDEAQCFSGVEDRHEFLTSMERAMVLKQRLEMIKAPKGGLRRPSSTLMHHSVHTSVPPEEWSIAEGEGVMEKLRRLGVLEQLLPLHEKEQLKWLQRNWVYAVFDEQPLEEVKDYFGHEIALYFAWLGHLTSVLWAPALFGLLLALFGGCFQLQRNILYPSSSGQQQRQQAQPTTSIFADVCFVSFALFNCLWSTAYLESWKRRQAELAFKWGTYDMSNEPLSGDVHDAAPRAGFHAEGVAPNPVTGRLEPAYPRWKHAAIRWGISYPMTVLVIATLLGAQLLLMMLQDWADACGLKQSWFTFWLVYLPVLAQGLLVQGADQLYRHLALRLNDLENYRSDEDYENQLIIKIASFQCMSAFASLFYIAFYLRDISRLQEMLAALLITRQLTQNVVELALPFLTEKLRLCKLTYRLTKSISNNTLRRQAAAVKKRRKESEIKKVNTAEGEPSESWMSVFKRVVWSSPLSTTTAYTQSPSSSVGRKCSRWDSMRLRGKSIPERNIQLIKKFSSSSLAKSDQSEGGGRESGGVIRKHTSSNRLPVPEFQPDYADRNSISSEGVDQEKDAEFELTEAELQTLMTEYVRPLDDYLEMFIQFGYVLLFSPAFPLAALCALANNIAEIRIDAFKLCNAVQRPFGRQVRSIGAWQRAMELMGIVGVMVNCALIGQSGLLQRIWPEISFSDQLLIVVVLEHAIMALKVAIDAAIPDVPRWVQIEMAKVEHWRREAYKRETKLASSLSVDEPDEPTSVVPKVRIVGEDGEDIGIEGLTSKGNVVPLPEERLRGVNAGLSTAIARGNDLVDLDNHDDRLQRNSEPNRPSGEEKSSSSTRRRKNRLASAFGQIFTFSSKS